MKLQILSQTGVLGNSPSAYFTGDSPFAVDPQVVVSILALIFVVAVITLIFYKFTQILKKQDAERRSHDYVMLLVRVPYENEIPIKAAEQMFASLYGIYKKKNILEKLVTADQGISFEIIGYPEHVGFYIHTPRRYSELVEKLVLGVYQNGEIVEVPEPNFFKDGSVVACGEFSLGDQPYNPLKTYADYEEKSDPLTSLAGAFANMVDGEGGAIQLVVVPADMGWSKKGIKYVTKINEHNNNPDKKNKIGVAQEKLSAITKKTGKVGFKTYIRVVMSAPTMEMAESRMNTLSSAFSQYTFAGSNYFKFSRAKGDSMRNFMFNFVYRRALGKSAIINSEELATVYHYPNKNTLTPNIDWLMSKKAPPPANLPNSGVWHGTSVYRGVKRPVYLQLDDRRRHTYIIGQTGTGKSWLEVSLALQDIYQGQGIAFLDPHGSAIEEIIRRIPIERAEDVIYFNPSDTERPLGFNYIESRNEFERHEVVNGFLALMHKMFDPHNQGIVGPRFERAVRNAMLAVMVEPSSTLMEVLHAITDERFALSFMDRVKDEEVRHYWLVEMANTDRREKSEILGWITSKFDRFTTNLLIRNIIGQSQSSFDFRKEMDNKKIILINLAKGLIGEENAQFLGLIMIPKILRAALSREDTLEKDRKDFFLYVDEFQNFATEEFASILSEARKYRLNLVVANQYISQMNEKVRDAVFGNVGQLVSFRVGATDGEYLAKEFGPIFNQQDLIKLENANAYIKALVNGVAVQPFSMSTFYDMESTYPDNGQLAQLIKTRCRNIYGRDVNYVKEEIEKRLYKPEQEKSQSSNFGMPPSIF